MTVRSPLQIDPNIQLGRGEAEARSLSVAGTLNVLEAAANRDLLELPTAIAKLQKTNFHISERIIQRALKNNAERRA